MTTLFLCVIMTLLTVVPVLSFTSLSRYGLSSRFQSSFSTCEQNKIVYERNRMTMAAEFDWKGLKKKSEDAMKKSMDALGGSFNTLRAGGANPAILDRVMVDNYGAMAPLNSIARVGNQGSQQLTIEPFDKALCKEIEKAISQSGLNLTPNNDGNGVIRINIPPLTEDRRKELAKQAKTMTEDAKVSIRNNRRDAVDAVKKAEKDKAVDKDTSKKYQDDLQKITDDFIKKIDEMLKKKDKDLLTI